MAKKKNKQPSKSEILEKKIFIVLSTILKPLFSLIAFIFWKNKYSKQYWARKREWRKTMCRLRSRAQKDIILTTIVPELEKRGFQREPFPSWWGWNYCIQGYDYELIRIKGDELQNINIYTHFGHSYFQFVLTAFKLKPNINEISELAQYDSLLFYPEWNKASVQDRFIKYKLKSFSSEKELEKRKDKLRRKFEKWLSNIDEIFDDWHKKHTPAAIDLNQKLKEKEERDKADIATKQPTKHAK